MNDFLERLDHGITVIDTGFQRARFDASYLIVRNGRAAFVDTGPNLAVPRLLAALEAQGLNAGRVDWLILTHVHLDHAGGAGQLMRHLPHARMVVHSRGARHMIEPIALIDGARAVYGDEVFMRDYGTIEPVPKERVVSVAEDPFEIELGGSPLLFIDTPGHARHHHCIWDEASKGWFTGDTFGIAYPELVTRDGRFVIPSTTPVQFDPAALHNSVGRLLKTRPERMYLTHFAAVEDVERLAGQLLRQADRMVARGRELAATGFTASQLEEAMAQIYLAEYRAGGGDMEEGEFRRMLALDITLNAQGMAVWLRSLEKEAAAKRSS